MEGTSTAIWLDTESHDNRITALTTQSSYKLPDDSKLNTIDGKPVLHFYNETSVNVSDFNVTTSTTPILIGGSTATGGYALPGGAGGISTGLALISTTNSIVQNNTISGFKGMPGGTGGYYGYGGAGGTIAGIYLSGSTGNNLTSNTISSLTGGTGGTGGYYYGGGNGRASTGIHLSSSISNSLTSNTISSLTGGTGGTGGRHGPPGASGTSYSLYLYKSNSTTIKEHTLETTDYCLYLYSSNNNIIYHNNFNASTNQVYNHESNNTWDNGFPSGGNYWSDYPGVDNYSGPFQNETGGDGIGDTPYEIDEYNNDSYPLMSPWPQHEIAIINVTLSNTEAYAGQTVNISVVAKNWGDHPETFNVTAFYDDTAIGTQEVSSLAPGAETNLTFSWNTTDVAGGYYTISANASAVPDEANTENNIFTDGTVKITSPVRIVEVIPCNQTGYPEDTFQLGTLAYFKVTMNSTALIPQDTLITINLYDNATVTIGIASFQGPILPGTSTIIFGLPIPTTATTGTATVYANAYTDWPHLGGFPHCPETSATLEITGP